VRLAALIALAAMACSTSTGHGDPNPKPADPPPTAAPPPAGKPTMDVTYQDLPDDKWRHAAEIVAAASRDLLAQAGSARAVIHPYASPDGAIVPYLLFVEATAAAGAPTFRGSAAVWGDKLANRGGAAVLTGMLAAAGFPARHVALGHLLELFAITGAVDLSWFSPPSAAGWDGVARPFFGTDLVPAVEYGKAGAVVHLYRGVGSAPGSAAPPAGPGFEAPAVERLDVAFDARAGLTTTTLRPSHAKTAGATVWQVVP
jgi:hypothetical protein